MEQKRNQTKYAAFVAASIDGRIAKSGASGTDWTSPEDWKFFQRSLKGFEAIIVGHNTYKIAGKNLKKRNTIVLTGKVKAPKEGRTEGSVTFLNPRKSDLKKLIENRKYKKIAVVGGPRVYNFCLENSMLDELFVTIEPYVFTKGVPMFTGTKFKKYGFALESIKKLNKKGTILLKYVHAG